MPYLELIHVGRLLLAVLLHPANALLQLGDALAQALEARAGLVQLGCQFGDLLGSLGGVVFRRREGLADAGQVLLAVLNLVVERRLALLDALEVLLEARCSQLVLLHALLDAPNGHEHVLGL